MHLEHDFHLTRNGTPKTLQLCRCDNDNFNFKFISFKLAASNNNIEFNFYC